MLVYNNAAAKSQIYVSFALGNPGLFAVASLRREEGLSVSRHPLGGGRGSSSVLHSCSRITSHRQESSRSSSRTQSSLRMSSTHSPAASSRSLQINQRYRSLIHLSCSDFIHTASLSICTGLPSELLEVSALPVRPAASLLTLCRKHSVDVPPGRWRHISRFWNQHVVSVRWCAPLATPSDSG